MERRPTPTVGASSSFAAAEGIGQGPPEGPLAVRMDPEASIDPADVESDAVMPLDECRSTWQKIFALVRMPTNEQKQQIQNGVLAFMAKNGPSPRGPGIRHVRIGEGKKIPWKAVLACIHGPPRRFARAHADIVRALLNNSPEFASELASAKGVSTDHQDIAFDFADYCSNLSNEERTVIFRMKQFVLGTTANYDQNPVEVASNVQGMPLSEPPRPSPYRFSEGHVR